MKQIVLIGFLPDDNRCSCVLHPFGCGNSLVLNQDDTGVGMVLRLQIMARNELAYYSIFNDGGCCICFMLQEFAVGGNGCWLDGKTVHITDMFTPESKNRPMRHLYHHNRGYNYVTILSLSS